MSGLHLEVFVRVTALCVPLVTVMALTATPRRASADPITATFSIQMTSQEGSAIPPGVNVVGTQFVLALTIDPDLAPPIFPGNPRSYGPAFFSLGVLDIPLPIPEIPPGLPVTASSS